MIYRCTKCTARWLVQHFQLVETWGVLEQPAWLKALRGLCSNMSALTPWWMNEWKPSLPQRRICAAWERKAQVHKKNKQMRRKCRKPDFLATFPQISDQCERLADLCFMSVMHMQHGAFPGIFTVKWNMAAERAYEWPEQRKQSVSHRRVTNRKWNCRDLSTTQLCKHHQRLPLKGHERLPETNWKSAKSGQKTRLKWN